MKEKMAKTIRARAQFQETGEVEDNELSKLLTSLNLMKKGKIPEYEKSNVLNYFKYLISSYMDEIKRNADILKEAVNLPKLLTKPETGNTTNDVDETID